MVGLLGYRHTVTQERDLDALSRVRRHISRHSFLVFLRTRSCDIGASGFAPSRDLQRRIAREHAYQLQADDR